MQWEGVEDKTSVLVYAGGAVAVLWLSSSLVGAINNVPLVRAPLVSTLAISRASEISTSRTGFYLETVCSLLSYVSFEQGCATGSCR